MKIELSDSEVQTLIEALKFDVECRPRRAHARALMERLITRAATLDDIVSRVRTKPRSDDAP